MTKLTKILTEAIKWLGWVIACIQEATKIAG